jgi:hypothetical protein
MIVSHRNRFIFTAIPKTGTHSVRRALRAHLGPEDIEQVRLFDEKLFPFPELAAVGHGHISLSQIRPFLDADAFNSYLKFAFVRNPFDRFVSYCAFMTRETDEFRSDPRNVMRFCLFKDRPLDHPLFQPQHLFLTDASGAMLADMVGRVEEMQDAYNAICTRLGIPTAALEKVNSSRRGDYRAYYDQVLMNGVAELYQRDLELFGYGFEGLK